MIEEQIKLWRSFLERRQAIHTVDVAELEDHLREQISHLTDSGLDEEEAFLVGVKRLGELDALSREFAREHSERLWKQLVMTPVDGVAEPADRNDALTAFLFAVAAAVCIKLPELFGIPFDDPDAGFYVHNLPFFVLPVLTAYFAWKRRLERSTMTWLGAAFAVAAAVANIHPFVPEGHTEVLMLLHLPIALWLAVGVAYTGGRWAEVGARMDFVRFSGELFIYFVLIALGGGVFTGFTALIFTSIGLDPERFIQSWLLPCGAMGAVIVASWLVEAKQSVIENMAPVLTRIFTPLFALLLVAFLVATVITGQGVNIEREMLIAFDLLLVVVLGLLLYAVSARDPWALPGPFDWAQVVLVISALLVDAVALSAIVARIHEFGFTPNRVAALGLNIILLVNLAWSAVLYVRFMRGTGLYNTLERWQTAYLPVFAGWATIVVVVFPPLFNYI